MIATSNSSKWNAPFLAAWVAGTALAALFWMPLLRGAGLTGGDVYAYSLPLKQYYAEGLKAGQLRFWNPRLGLGVPMLDESQTGVFYPLNLAAYRFLDLNSAFSALFLLHYVLAYIFTVQLARCVGLSLGSSLLTALVFVYGWFPPRACLEWAIVSGTWTPLLLLASLRWLQSGSARWGCALALTAAMQLSAGHFQIAFLTLLAILIVGLGAPIDEVQRRRVWTRRAWLPVFLACGFLIAAPQLLATWELRGRSGRRQADLADLAYGNIPLRYFLQLVAPLHFYSEQKSALVDLDGESNNIEAHLYVGLAPLALAAAAVLSRKGICAAAPWTATALIGAALASGAATPWLAKLPGFGYFHAPGRYGLLTQLGLAMLAGFGADRLFPRKSAAAAIAFIATITVTAGELYWVAHQVQIATATRPPMIDRLNSSPVCKGLRSTDRILAPVPNILTLSGASCVPAYLGLAPVEYSDLWDRKVIDRILLGAARAEPKLIASLREQGVTHLLTRDPLPIDWPVDFLWSGVDPFLDPLYYPNGDFTPLYFYRLRDALGRAYLRDTLGAERIGDGVQITSHEAQRVVLEATLDKPMQLVLAELNYPGWKVEVDGAPADAALDPIYRVVDLPKGKHAVVWTFAPTKLGVGLAASSAGMTAMIAAALWIRRRRLDPAAAATHR